MTTRRRQEALPETPAKGESRIGMAGGVGFPLVIGAVIVVHLVLPLPHSGLPQGGVQPSPVMI
jgi:hypothetical protein